MDKSFSLDKFINTQFFANNTGFRTSYRFFCNDEMKWITVEKPEGTLPTECPNDPLHSIKLESITGVAKYVNVVPITQSYNFDECDLTKVTLLDVHTKCALLARRVKVLEEILKRQNQIKYV